MNKEAGQQPTMQLIGIEKTYGQGDSTLTVLKDADLTLMPGEMVALVAPSGTGKSTLLHIAGLLEKPTSGEVYVGGAACHKLDDKALTGMRRTRSASSTSSIICCRSSPRLRILPCHR